MQEAKLLLTRQTLLQQGGLVGDLRTVTDELKQRLTSLDTELCLHTKSHEQQLDKAQQKLDAATAQLNDKDRQLRQTIKDISDKSAQFDNLQQQFTETSAQLEQAKQQAQLQQKHIEKQVTVLPHCMSHYMLLFSRNIFRAYRYKRRSTSVCSRTCSKKWPRSPHAQILLPALEAPRQAPQM